MVNTTEFGAFMKVAPGVVGMLHVSKMLRPDGSKAELGTDLDVGATVRVRIHNMTRNGRQFDAIKVDLSMIDDWEHTSSPGT